MTDAPVIHWFRRDLRLTDNAALNAALESGAPVAAVFIFDPAILKSDRLGLPRLAFMLDGLRSLDAALRQRHSRLIFRRGQPAPVLKRLVEELGAVAVYLNRDVSPYARRRDARVADALAVPIHDYDDLLLRAPGEVMKQDGSPYTVFTPFKHRWRLLEPIRAVETAGSHFYQPTEDAAGEVPTLHELGFASTIAVPAAGEAAAADRLRTFVDERLFDYAETRNGLATDPFGKRRTPTSGLSPFLRLGMMSVRQAYQAALAAGEGTRGADHAGVETWINELIWRDFYAHILYHFPRVDHDYFRPEYAALPYRQAPYDLQAWKNGQTGYPLIDAAMRQLQAHGWMPNRARMVVASFLTKDLLIDWREGERHFQHWLIDGDPAANNGGWQWAAGCGTDAQPFFRIFNPVEQSKRFDPAGDYIRFWVPELNAVSARFIHTPWEMPEPPKHYPPRIVDHAFARSRALEAFRVLRHP